MSRTETITTTTTSTRLSGSVGRVHRNRAADCRCGQQLDLCARAHCPRCGRSIARP